MNSAEVKSAKSQDSEAGRNPKGSPAKWFSRTRIALLVGVLVGLAIIQCSGVMDASIDSWVDPPDDGRPAFVATTYHRREGPSFASFNLRSRAFFDNLMARFGRRNPAAWSFNPGLNVESVHGLLNRCFNVTGTRYLIAREVANKSISFETTKPLNGNQWQAAAEQGLRDNGLLVLREERVVKLIPKDKLAAYRKAGLVKSGE